MPDLDPDEFRRLGHAVVDWVADHRAGLPERPVRPDVAPGWVRTRIGPLPEQPEPVEALLADLDAVIVPALTHWQHPRFLAYFPASASLHSVLGELLSAGLGNQGMLWSSGPAATELEQVLLDQLADALGLDPGYTFAGGGGGSIQDSASSAALVALVAALHRADPDWRERGVRGDERVYLTAETHSSMAKAVRVAGLGAEAVRIVPTRPDPAVADSATDPDATGPDAAHPATAHTMDPDALAAALAADVAAGLRPVLVCPTVGTTGTGAIDPVGPVCDAVRVAAEPGRPPAWVHVDAAWAGIAAVCPELRWIVAGTEAADSFCTDAHKWGLTAFDASLLWVRDAGALPAALSITPEFLRDAASDSGAVVDYRDWQVPLGRRFRAVKLWAVLRGHGLEGLRAHLRGHVELAARLGERVRAEPGFTLAAPVSLGLVCLRLVGCDDDHPTGTGNKTETEDDRATRVVLEQVNASGRVLLSHTTVDGRYVIRVAIGAVSTTAADIDEVWQLLRDTARRVRADRAATRRGSGAPPVAAR